MLLSHVSPSGRPRDTPTSRRRSDNRGTFCWTATNLVRSPNQKTSASRRISLSGLVVHWRPSSPWSKLRGWAMGGVKLPTSDSIRRRSAYKTSSTKAPFTRRRCEIETESLRIVSGTIVFGQSDRRVFTRRRCRDVQRRLRLVRRRSRASFVARRRLQNVTMRGLGHCAPQTHRDSTGVSKCIEERASACYLSSFFFSLETFIKKKMTRK